MSKIEQLIKRLCPNGVEYKPLNEIFRQFSGMTGVSNKWKETGNCKFIDYMNAYKNLKIDVNRLENATVKKIEQNKLKKGDILLTSASETPDECALSSVIEDNIADNVFMDDHLFGIRIKDEYKEYINTTYINYYMHTNSFRKDVFKAVRGVTRFYISVDTFMNIKVAVPPLEVQDEIVHILDDFTLLSAELSAELKAREKQYEYYREQLIHSEKENFQKLGTLCNIYTGGEAPDDCIKGNKSDEAHPYAVWGNGKEIYGYSSKYRIDKDAVVISSIGANTGSVYYRKAFFTPIIRLKVIIPKDDTILDSRYLFHALSSTKIESKSSSVPNMNANEIKALTIPVPNIEKQKQIANILDAFDRIINDISEGLPAEIKARQKQYEYYRDKLLTFKEFGNE